MIILLIIISSSSSSISISISIIICITINFIIISTLYHALQETLEGQQKESGDPGPRTELDFWRLFLFCITIMIEFY